MAKKSVIESETGKLDPIWPGGYKLEVIGLTGPLGSGKTLFGLTIDPEHTLYHDWEKSGGDYDHLFPSLERVDVVTALSEKFPKGYSPVQAFTWWLEQIKSIPDGKYTVIMADPVSDIEDALVDWVASRYKEFGFKSEEKFRDLGGVFWGRVKSEWKKILLGIIAAKCQTFVFTTHLRNVWKHGKPTNAQEAKGKSTLKETASLFLFLDRSPASKKDDPPQLPSAIVEKHRLVTFKDGKLASILPPRLPEATPEAIRQYILNPPDYSNLSPEEKEVIKELTDAEKLDLEKEIAETNREAAEAQERAALAASKVEESRQKALNKLRPTQPPQEAPAKEEPPAKDGPNKADQGYSVAKEVRDLLNAAHKAGELSYVLNYVHKTLKDRKVDVSGFTKDAAVEYTQKLTGAEFDVIVNDFASRTTV